MSFEGIFDPCKSDTCDFFSLSDLVFPKLNRAAFRKDPCRERTREVVVVVVVLAEFSCCVTVELDLDTSLSRSSFSFRSEFGRRNGICDNSPLEALLPLVSLASLLESCLRRSLDVVFVRSFTVCCAPLGEMVLLSM